MREQILVLGADSMVMKGQVMIVGDGGTTILVCCHLANVLCVVKAQLLEIYVNLRIYLHAVTLILP